MELFSLIFQEVTLQARKNEEKKQKKKQKQKKKTLLECFLYILYFRRELAMPENQKFLTFLSKHKCKRKMFLMLFLIKKQNFLTKNSFL